MPRFFLCALLFCSITCLGQYDGVKPFNEGWNFRLTDAEGAAKPFADGIWRSVTIPHDWLMALPVDQKNASGKGGGFYPGGKGEYKKTFRLPDTQFGRLHSIRFDGVYMNAEVYLNGHLLGKRPYGYVSVTYNMEPWLKYNDKNELLVKVDNSVQPSSRWYNGAGIYRNVWLLSTTPIHFERDSVFVQTHIDPARGKAYVDVYGSIWNETAKAQQVLYNLTVTNKAALPNPASQPVTVPANGRVSIHERIENDLSQLELWSPEHPRLYNVRVELKSQHIKLEALNYRIGYRDFRFTAYSGFLLNFKPYKIKGVNEHHDLGALGAAFHASAMKRRMLILKEMGCNAIRTAHNPPAPELLDLADELGFLVMDEGFDEWRDGWDGIDKGKAAHGYHELFQEWSKADLRDFMIRDRNHTSVFLWSVGNETPELSYAHGRARLDSLIRAARLWDTTRLVSVGTNQMSNANKNNFSPGEDVVGYNEGGGSVFIYEQDHQRYPDRIFIGTEVPHTFQTRGVYRTHTFYRDKNPAGGMVRIPDFTVKEFFPNVPRFYSSSYDNSLVRTTCATSWKLTQKFPFMSGEFRWTGFDYIGESNEGWPARFYNFGVIDMCGFPKDLFYFYQSVWSSRPMLHLFPHWTHPGKEGDSLRLVAYSNLDEVELFVNDRSMGRQRLDTATLSFYWTVAYHPGTIRAIGYRAGRAVLNETIPTAGAPAALRLEAEDYAAYIDKEQLYYVPVTIVDAKAVMSPDADNMVSFTTSANAQVLAVDNGDVLDNSSYLLPYRKSFKGKAIAIVKCLDGKRFSVTATSQGLSSASITINPSHNEKRP